MATTKTYLDETGLTLVWSKMNTTFATKTELGTKQDKLTAGTNIKISGNTISADSSLFKTIATAGTGNAITALTSNNNGTLTVSKGYLLKSVATGGSGNAITTASVSNGTLTLTKGASFANSTHTHNDASITYTSNKSGGVTPIDMAISNLHNANRIAFGKPAGVTVEYSNNGGSNWSDYGLTNEQKIDLISGIENSCYIGKKTTGITTNDMLRITLSSTQMGVYTACKKIFMNISTNGAGGSTVIVERMMKGSTTWSTVGSYGISGWSGWNTIPLSVNFGGSTNQTTNVDKIRLTYRITALTTTYSNALVILNLAMYGDTYWSYPSQMAKSGHLYEYNNAQDALFPGKIYQNKTKQVIDTINYNGSALANTNGTVTIPTDSSLLKSVATGGTGNAITSASASNGTLTLTKGTTFATKAQLDTKQDKLTAGTNISINGNTISTNSSLLKTIVTSGTGNAITSLTSNNNGTLTVSKEYLLKSVATGGTGNAITSASASNGTLTLTKGTTFATKAQLDTKQNKLTAGTNISINGNTISSTYTYNDTTVKNDIAALKTDKQDKLTAGTNISINGNTISTIQRGNRWTCGTAMTGTSTNGTIFSGSGISDAIVGDMYLNTNTLYVYQCTLAGNASVAKWVYRCDIGQCRLG